MRTERVEVRFTAEEVAVVEAQARAAGMSVAAYVRHRALHGKADAERIAVLEKEVSALDGSMGARMLASMAPERRAEVEARVRAVFGDGLDASLRASHGKDGA